MSAVNVTQVAILDNPSRFTNPLQFEIQYECLNDLQEDLEWKLTYVGSAEDEKHDQILDSVLVGPVVAGSYRFVFQADAPDPSKIPPADMTGVTVLLLTCAYRDKEFIRVGYYVNNEYDNEEMRENPPDAPVLDKLVRNILADKPRVTKFPIEFDAVSIPTVVSAVPAAVPAAGGDHSMDGSLAGDAIFNGMNTGSHQGQLSNGEAAMMPGAHAGVMG
eukprot:CAMPEP_0118926974 /NCGR_PEP_ID=MMETSP1169-20130426/4560_1 /TAXON_ID=36882 /ORGANISM="Pyramimonas obovata, Strain CCMP722" /LENGTH=217 /DNA_ID=CAMNT_0006868643 /DNA_START=484 /DNA_END=1133 /DNA_ORIENTATION=-